MTAYCGSKVDTRYALDARYMRPGAAPERAR